MYGENNCMVGTLNLAAPLLLAGIGGLFVRVLFTAGGHAAVLRSGFCNLLRAKRRANDTYLSINADGFARWLSWTSGFLMDDANTRIINRLLQSIADFKSGKLEVAELQGSILGHGHALEGVSNTWHNFIDAVEGKLELLQFTTEEPERSNRIDEVLKELEEMALKLGPESKT